MRAGWGRYDAQMSDWMLVVVGLAMWAVIIAACVFGKRTNEGCPSCEHNDEADSTGRCVNADAYCGWGSDACNCTDAYHANQPQRSAQTT